MNMDHFALRDASRAESTAIAKREKRANGAEKREFVASYQEARKQRENRAEQAQNNASRARRKQLDAAEQANKSARDSRKTAPHSASDKIPRSGFSENGKPLPATEVSGNSMQVAAGDKQETSPMREQIDREIEQAMKQLRPLQGQEGDEGDDEIDDRLMLGLAQDVRDVAQDGLGLPGESEAGDQSVMDAASKRLLETNSAETSNERSPVFSDVQKAEGFLEGEGAADSLSNLDLESALGESANGANREDARLDELAQTSNVAENASDMAVEEEQVESYFDSTEVLLPEQGLKIDTRQSKERNAENTSASAVVLDNKIRQAATLDAKLTDEEVEVEIEPSATKVSAKAYYNDARSGRSLEQQQALLQEQSGKADIKLSSTDGTSVSELAIKEAKSGLGAKTPDFIRAFAAEKLPLRETIDLPVSHKNWGEVLAEKTALLVSQKGSFARLNLVPHNLGPLEVRVQLQGETSSVEFIVVNHATKDAIESAIPRLREMFESGGLELGDVNVNSQSKRDGDTERTLMPGKDEERVAEDVDLAEEAVRTRGAGSLLNGRVDFYA